MNRSSECTGMRRSDAAIVSVAVRRLTALLRNHNGIGPAKEVDLVAREIETSQAQFGDRLDRVERESDAPVLIGEQLVDDHSNARS